MGEAESEKGKSIEQDLPLTTLGDTHDTTKSCDALKEDNQNNVRDYPITNSKEEKMEKEKEEISNQNEGNVVLKKEDAKDVFKAIKLETPAVTVAVNASPISIKEEIKQSTEVKSSTCKTPNEVSRQLNFNDVAVTKMEDKLHEKVLIDEITKSAVDIKHENPSKLTSAIEIKSESIVKPLSSETTTSEQDLCQKIPIKAETLPKLTENQLKMESLMMPSPAHKTPFVATTAMQHSNISTNHHYTDSTSHISIHNQSAQHQNHSTVSIGSGGTVPGPSTTSSSSSKSATSSRRSSSGSSSHAHHHHNHKSSSSSSSNKHNSSSSSSANNSSSSSSRSSRECSRCYKRSKIRRTSVGTQYVPPPPQPNVSRTSRNNNRVPPGLEHLKYGQYFEVEVYPNGGASVVHLYQDEIKDLPPHEMDELVDEFFEVCFAEDEEGYAHHVMGIVHDAARYLPDLLQHMAENYSTLTVKAGVLGRNSDIETCTMAQYYEQVSLHPF